MSKWKSEKSEESPAGDIHHLVTMLDQTQCHANTAADSHA